MMENDTPFTCPECDFCFGVIWCNNAMAGLPQINFCPRCGYEGPMETE